MRDLRRGLLALAFVIALAVASSTGADRFWRPLST
jgi:hypothetical protein